VSATPRRTSSRQAFLVSSGTLIVAFPLLSGGSGAAPALTGGKSVATDQVDAFLSIDGKGDVTVYSGKVELGTGVSTAIVQIVAEELSVAFDRVKLVQGDTSLTPNQGPTFASLSIQNGGTQIRTAAATAREALLSRAAHRLRIPKQELSVHAGIVTPRSGGKGISYAELAGQRAIHLTVDPHAPLKSPKQYTIVGTSVPRIDIPAKVLGRFEYVHDVRVAGMLHARMVHPPAMGATLESFDEAGCKKIAGYARAVRLGNFLAVVATNEWAAIKAATAIEATWTPWAGLPDENGLFKYVRATPMVRTEVLQNFGDSTAAMKGAGRTLNATYDFAINTHGSIGPSCSIADYRDGRLVVWTASQAAHLLRLQLATMLDLAPEKVRCIYVEGAGCYGRNGHEDCTSEAALISNELGRPVRLQWMRGDEHGWDPKNPPIVLDYRARLDSQGQIAAWESEIFVPERTMQRSGVTLLGAELAKLPRYGSDTPGKTPPGGGVPYNLPNARTSARWLATTPLKSAWIRAPGRMQMTFGNESFLDELAAATKSDPFDFRTQHLTDSRGLEVLRRLRDLAKWEPGGARPRDSGQYLQGRGLAYTKYELVRTYIGIVADVTVSRTSGVVKVDRVFVVHDCGQIINPDGLRNQIEGNVVQTVSRTLIEEVTFDRSTVTSRDWASYPILTFPDVPAVTIELIDRPEDPPWGAGEPTSSAIPAAIANAIFDATGVRLRSIPFRAAKVLAALKSAQT
jgi:nicotinate dehydrogenase subunit B